MLPIVKKGTLLEESPLNIPEGEDAGEKDDQEPSKPQIKLQEMPMME
jgi:hypothetical protein